MSLGCQASRNPFCFVREDIRELLCGCWVLADPQARGDPQPSSEGSCWVGEGQRGKTSTSCFAWKAAGLGAAPGRLVS